MDLLLRNNDRYTSLAAITDERELRVLSGRLARHSRDVPVFGFWGDLGEHRLAIYSDGEALFLHADGEELKLDDLHEAGYQRSGGAVTLTLYLGREVPLKLRYELPEEEPTVVAPNRFEVLESRGDEEFDFGLYVAETVNSRERREHLISRARGIREGSWPGEKDEPRRLPFAYARELARIALAPRRKRSRRRPASTSQD